MENVQLLLFLICAIIRGVKNWKLNCITNDYKDSIIIVSVVNVITMRTTVMRRFGFGTVIIDKHH